MTTTITITTIAHDFIRRTNDTAGSSYNLVGLGSNASSNIHTNITTNSSDSDHDMTGRALSKLDETNPRLVNGVVVLLLMLFNLGGNGLVLYIYHYLFRHSVFNLFVKALASLDLLTAVTTMMIDVMMKMRDNNDDQFHTQVMCKMSHFQVYANSMASGCVLTLIAYQRYTKICHPLERGMQLKRAKTLLIITCIACLVISTPTIFLYGARKIRVLVRSTEVHATICRAEQSYQDTPLNFIFYYILMIAFCLVLVSICVLYCMVSRSIRKFEQRTSIISVPSPGGNNHTLNTINEESFTGNGRNYQVPNSPQTNRTLASSPGHGRPIMTDPFKYRHGHQATYAPQSPGTGSAHRGVLTPASKKREQFSQKRVSTFSVASSGANVISHQMYRVFSIITVVYIISYLPHLVALILTKVLHLDDEVLTYTQRMALEFAYNCPYISTVSNPIIYGFSSTEFRDKVREFLNSCDGCCSCDCEDMCCCCGECCGVFDCCDDCNDD